MFFGQAFLERFQSPKAYRTAIIIGVLIALPTLGAGLFVDDYLHILTIEKKIHIASGNEVFEFATGNREINREMMNTGPYPWFINQDLKIKFMRPLSSLLMRMDHALFGRNAVGYHLHSVLWYFACLLIVSCLYRRTLPLGIGALALLLYAVDLGHLIPVGWWSNRNALVATVPALLGLLCHSKYREDNWHPGLPLSILCFALGLGGGETGLGIFGYLFAYELLAAPGTLIKRFFMLVPAGILGLTYVILYKTLEYGVHGSGVYIDPTQQTMEYLINAPSRLILNIAAHIVMLPVEIPVILTWTYWPLTAIATAIVVVLFYILRGAWPAIDPEEKRHLRWYILGALISALPILATFPSIRLMMMPSLGSIAVLAVILNSLLRDTARWRVYTGRGLAALHLILAPAVWLLLPIPTAIVEKKIQQVFDSAEYDHNDVANHSIIVLRSENPLFGFYPMIFQAYDGYPDAKSWWPMSISRFEHQLTRTGENTYEMEIIAGEMLTSDVERLFRSDEPKFKVGEEVKLDGMTITILAVGNIGPTKFKVKLEKNLDDPQYIYLVFQEHKLKRVTMPAIGQGITFTHQPML